MTLHKRKPRDIPEYEKGYKAGYQCAIKKNNIWVVCKNGEFVSLHLSWREAQHITLWTRHTRSRFVGPDGYTMEAKAITS